jgi:hypothetical protein
MPVGISFFVFSLKIFYAKSPEKQRKKACKMSVAEKCLHFSMTECSRGRRRRQKRVKDIGPPQKKE